MKIKRIEIRNFRAFPDGVPFAFDLYGKNLLLYGENGAGKSSLYRALLEFFDLEISAPKFETFVHRFSPGAAPTNGHVSLVIEDRNVESTWKWDRQSNAVRPQHERSHSDMDRRAIVDCANRSGFLCYRSLLQTHFGERTPAERLFGLAISTILAGLPVLNQGSPTTLNRLWKSLAYSLPTRNTQAMLNRVEQALQTFNNAFSAALPDIQLHTETFLNYFAHHALGVRFSYPGVRYNRALPRRDKRFVDEKLNVEITFHGQPISDWNEFLNEARLCALALSIYFAGIKLCNPAPAGNWSPLQLIVLDDVLVGLDYANRIPVLKILDEHFRDFQVLLLTHDRVWFELACGYLRSSDNWLHLEMPADESTGTLIPLLKPKESDIKVANEHLKKGDLRAAAVYARSALKCKLRKTADAFGIHIPFKEDPRKITLETIWSGIKARQRDREEARSKGSVVNDFIDANLENDIETVRSTVLNQLSHTGVPNLTKPEVQFALDVIERVCNYQFKKVTSQA